ncbi:hypothetical protein [Vibrio sp. FJH11]
MDVALIVPLKTLTGIDALHIAERSRWNVQLYAIDEQWDASLDNSTIYRVDPNSILSRQEEASNNAKMRLESVELEDITSHIILNGVLNGTLVPKIWLAQGREVVQLANDGAISQAVSDWLAEPLTAEEKAAAIFERDYIAGLSVEGLSFEKVQKLVNRNNSLMSVDGQQITKSPIDFHCIDLGDEISLYLVDSTSMSETEYEWHKKTLLDEINLQHCQSKIQSDNDVFAYVSAAHQHAPVQIPTSLVLFCKAADRALEGEPLMEKLSRIELIEFVSSQKVGTGLTQIATKQQTHGLAKLNVFSGKYSHYLRAEILSHEANDTRAIIDFIVNQLLGVALKGNRPLCHFSSTFYLPFRLKNSDELKITSGELAKYEQTITSEDDKVEESKKIGEEKGEIFNVIANERDSFLYFDPVIRERFFESNNDGKTQPIYEWRAKIRVGDELDNEVDNYYWSFAQLDNSGQELWFHGHVRSIRLLRFYNGVHILAVQVFNRFFKQYNEDNSTGCTLTRSSDSWWHDLFNSDYKERIESSYFWTWLDYTNKVRELFPSFAEREYDKSFVFTFGKRDKVDTAGRYSSIGADEKALERDRRQLDFGQLADNKYLLPHDVKQILSEIADVENVEFKPFVDNRMFVSATYGFAGNPDVNETARAHYDALFSLAAYVDSKGFDSLGGYAYDPDFVTCLLEEQSYTRWRALGNQYAFTNYSNVYLGWGRTFNENIAPCHVAYNYQNMLLIALFYRESLHDFSQRVSDLSKEIETKSASDFKSVRQDIIKFTNVSWFQEVSAQIQGKEIFSKQLQGLDVEKEFEFIANEIDVAYKHFQEQTMERITVVAAVLALLSLISGAFSISTLLGFVSIVLSIILILVYLFLPTLACEGIRFMEVWVTEVRGKIRKYDLFIAFFLRKSR